jgi:hypothetical protein
MSRGANKPVDFTHNGANPPVKSTSEKKRRAEIVSNDDNEQARIGLRRLPYQVGLSKR